MSFIVFGNLPISVPPVKDTTPCLEQMTQYENCITDAGYFTPETVHPNWPTMFPRLLSDGKLVDPEYHESFGGKKYEVELQLPLTKKDKQYLWECEEERFVYKACLRKLISLKRTAKHTSWHTAQVSNLSFQ
jgi:hypothetical protein